MKSTVVARESSLPVLQKSGSEPLFLSLKVPELASIPWSYISFAVSLSLPCVNLTACISRGQDQRRLQRDRQLDLSRALESSRQSLAAAARRIGAPQWCLQLVVEKNSSVDAAAGGGGGGDGGGSGRNGHRGFLFELFELRQGPQDTAKHSQALASLLGEKIQTGAKGDKQRGGVVRRFPF